MVAATIADAACALSTADGSGVAVALVYPCDDVAADDVKNGATAMAPVNDGLLAGVRESGARFVMPEPLLAIGDDSYIENAAGLRAYWVDGKALRVRETLIFKDLQGNEIYKIQERKARIRDTMKIQTANGDDIAIVKKALVSPIRDRFDISIPNGTDLDAKGNILQHEYKVKRDGEVIAEISKKWVRVRDTYTVDVTPGEDVLLLLAITTALDTLADPGM